jgi:hypothetical protein
MSDSGPTMSPLRQSLTTDGHTIQIEIYEGDPGKWILEVVDEHGTSTIWDHQFDTDREALDELLRTLSDEGIDKLIDPRSTSEHGGRLPDMRRDPLVSRP